MTNPAVEDAWELFESYMTLNGGAVRSYPNGPGSYFYPHAIAQQDMIAFATVFTILWETMRNEEVDFPKEYKNKPDAFAEIAKLAEPRGFWVLDQNAGRLKRRVVKDKASTRSLCRTLRNGFNHFHYRYSNLSPDEYFKRLGEPSAPKGITTPHTADNFRIFICDHANGKKLMDPGSDTRILDVPFGHLRYHLHLFLVRFFRAEGVGVIKDVFGNPQT